MVVALRKESVDRNQYLSGVMDFAPGVALRKESVDRNCAGLVAGSKHIVALRKESVDRNGFVHRISPTKNTSLSARRAWIEIPVSNRKPVQRRSLSARRAWIEMETMLPSWTRYASLSARRAWIEIFADWPAVRDHQVALRKESVDRNIRRCAACKQYFSRSPQGERG